jgi:hypothetical protein
MIVRGQSLGQPMAEFKLDSGIFPGTQTYGC